MIQIKNKLQQIYTYNPLRVDQWSPYENIYYCCTQKTASQWFKDIFRDPVVYKYTGLKVIPYAQLGLREAHFDAPFPERKICTHLYISYPTYLTIPKPAKYRAFFILRDPRDVVVSWYFSMRYSHRLIDPVPKIRKELENLSLNEGLRYCIDNLEEIGLFWVQRSWMQISEDQQNIKVFRYEDFADDNYSFMMQLLDYLKIGIPEQELIALHERHNFAKRTGGRKQGTENKMSNLRKGVSGDWKNYFDDSLMAHFRQVTKDLLEVLEYQE